MAVTPEVSAYLCFCLSIYGLKYEKLLFVCCLLRVRGDVRDIGAHRLRGGAGD